MYYVSCLIRGGKSDALPVNLRFRMAVASVMMGVSMLCSQHASAEMSQKTNWGSQPTRASASVSLVVTVKDKLLYTHSPTAESTAHQGGWSTLSFRDVPESQVSGSMASAQWLKTTFLHNLPARASLSVARQTSDSRWIDTVAHP